MGCSLTEVRQPVFLVSEAKSESPPKAEVPTIKPKKVANIKGDAASPLEVQETDEEQPSSALAQVQEVKLATITTDYTNKTYDLILNLDADKKVTAIKTKSNKGKVKIYPVEVLGKQIVLVKAVGISLVTLRCLNFDQSQGCPIEIEYPSNLTYGKFLRFESRLVKADNQWQLQSQDRRFASMHLVAKKVFGILIGVERIELR